MGPTFEVVLRNDGPEPVRVPATLSYPRNVFFSFKPAGTDGPTGYAIEGRAPGEVMPLTYPDEPGILAQLPRGSRWDAEAFEPRAEGLDHTTTLLAPGGELRRRFYLPDLVAGEGQMSHGRWELRAYWRNRESGKRLGIEPEMPTVVLSASPIEVGGRGW